MGDEKKPVFRLVDFRRVERTLDAIYAAEDANARLAELIREGKLVWVETPAHQLDRSFSVIPAPLAAALDHAASIDGYENPVGEADAVVAVFAEWAKLKRGGEG